VEVPGSNVPAVGSLFIISRVERLDPKDPTAASHPLAGQGVLLYPSLGGAISKKAQAEIAFALPIVVDPQPVPFSHRQHSAQEMKCHDCHGKAQTQERAGIPSASQCMFCHVSIRKDSPYVQRLAQLVSKGEPIHWVRVYRLPDFVFFSHQVHVKARVDCQTCHGPIAERDVLQKEVSTSMRTCVDCHRSRKAPVDCSRCHELGQ